ncbi:NAD(P)/FAD-dependent oxidoreductase [Arenibacterium sp. CAU 1754]
MPFENSAGAPKKIAVIGGGISGMGAAHMLADTHNVTLYENEKRLGGHARTVMAGKNGDQPVDTGFIVFNKVNYPNLVDLFDGLNVPVVPSDMSFGASIDGGWLEYSLRSLNTVFAQRRNAVRPAFLGMARDVLRFNANALELSQDRRMTVGQLLDQLGTGDWFRDYYLLPFSGAIWSTPKDKIMDFPAYAMVRFFENHALLSHTGQHQWYTVQGGSVEYVRRLETAMQRKGVDLRLGSPVQAVRRTVAGVQVKAWGGDWETYDDVVFATHSDDAMRLLEDATPREKATVGAITYQPNDIVLHADTSVMPKRRSCWSSWVYTEDRRAPSDKIDLTYWMNSLQPIPEEDPHFVTLNTKRQIREELIYDTVTLRHPVYDTAALEAQERVREFNGTQSTWFCGAWMRNGFHEDGLASAHDVVHAISRADRAVLAAE